MSIEKLEAEVMNLPADERERLGEKLLGSVPPSLDHEDAWAEEADRRVREIRGGDVKPVSSEEMFREALERLK